MKRYKKQNKGTETSTKPILFPEYGTRLKMFTFCDKILLSSLNYGHRLLRIKSSELLPMIHNFTQRINPAYLNDLPNEK